MAWEKIIAWIIAAIVIFVVVFYLASQLGNGGIIDSIFGATKDTGSQFTTVVS